MRYLQQIKELCKYFISSTSMYRLINVLVFHIPRFLISNLAGLVL